MNLTWWQWLVRSRTTQLTRHFRRTEFDCHDGTPYPQEWIQLRLMKLCTALERIRLITGPIKITSGYRTVKHNRKIGGVEKSQHIFGMAADLTCQLPSHKLHDIILKLIRTGEIPQGGVGHYRTFVHYDLRGTPARWSAKNL